jgi:hypothetical protein
MLESPLPRVASCVAMQLTIPAHSIVEWAGYSMCQGFLAAQPLRARAGRLKTYPGWQTIGS